MIASWTLEDLTERMREVLAKTGLAEDASKANGQIAEVPNARTVRYYTTIGVLDRPEQRGRTALYGRRHLEQLVAIKRLQAEGQTLADIQRAVVGIDDHALAKLAKLPKDAGEPHGPVEKPRDDRRERSFWSAAPAAPTHHVPEAKTATAVTGVQLENGVTLTFPSARAVDDDDRKALRAALSEVVEVLRARGLL
jgi:DNA-binding transcriptional MerR regulator